MLHLWHLAYSTEQPLVHSFTADDQRSFLNEDKVDPHVLLLFQ